MIVEKRTYTLCPGGVPQYMAIYEEFGVATQKKILGKMVGWYYPEIGELNQIIHMWGYKDLADRAKRRERLGKAKAWQTYLSKIREAQLIVKQENQILIPAPWSPKPR
jgi:hypothetical protein